jgi:MSHA pilin protein MshC
VFKEGALAPSFSRINDPIRRFAMMRRDLSGGFTLLELLSIILIIGIISAVAVSRLDISPFRTASFEQELRSAIRFAQKFAIVSGCEVEVDVSVGGYVLSVRDDADTVGCLAAAGTFGADLLNNPTGGTFTAAPPAGVVVSVANFIYDRRGQPSGGAIITVDTQTITVEAVTGYVH